MSRISSDGITVKTARLIDSEGELYTRPAGLGYVFGALVILTGLEAMNGVFGVGVRPRCTRRGSMIWSSRRRRC